jgi:hypothetical protein
MRQPVLFYMLLAVLQPFPPFFAGCIRSWLYAYASYPSFTSHHSMLDRRKTQSGLERSVGVSMHIHKQYYTCESLSWNQSDWFWNRRRSPPFLLSTLLSLACSSALKWKEILYRFLGSRTTFLVGGTSGRFINIWQAGRICLWSDEELLRGIFVMFPN